MNPVKRYMETNNKRKMILDIMSRGDYVGSGLAVGITLGPLKIDHGHEINVEVADPNAINDILQSVCDGLDDSLRTQELFIRDECAELTAFIDNQLDK